MVYLYWVAGILAAYVIGVFIYAGLGPKPITIYLKEKLFPQAKTIFGEYNPAFLDDEKGMIYFSILEDKKALGYRADHLKEITEVYDGDTVEVSDKENIILQNISLIFVDGCTHTISFNRKQNALAAREKICGWCKVFSFNSDSDTPLFSADTTGTEAAHSADRNKVLLSYTLFAFIALMIGHFVFISESESDRRKRIAEEKARTEDRVEKACSEPSQAIGYSKQLIRKATSGSVSFIRSSTEGRLVGECKFRVMGAIEGENAFGGPVTNYYVITMEGERSQTNVRWFGSSPIIDSNLSTIQSIYYHKSD